MATPERRPLARRMPTGGRKKCHRYGSASGPPTGGCAHCNRCFTSSTNWGGGRPATMIKPYFVQALVRVSSRASSGHLAAELLTPGPYEQNRGGQSLSADESAPGRYRIYPGPGKQRYASPNSVWRHVGRLAVTIHQHTAGRWSGERQTGT